MYPSPIRFLAILLTSGLFTLTACTLPSTTVKTHPMLDLDWQGHRGARGALPENTIPSFLHALQFSYIQTIELDVVVSADSQIVISHEPYFSHHISSHPDGKPVGEAEAKQLNLFQMSLAEIQTYDVGKRGNERFPKQQPLPVSKPSLKQMVATIDDFCKKNDRPLTRFNIELKSHADSYDIYVPQPQRFVALLLSELKDMAIMSRVNLQSFDTQILEAIHEQAPEASTALLVEELDSFENYMSSISFQPTNLSPYFEFVTESLIEKAHAKGIKIIPWTVNELADIKRMVDLGVDGIITDYVERPAVLMQ